MHDVLYNEEECTTIFNFRKDGPCFLAYGL
jgi:hypothetical protein